MCMPILIMSSVCQRVYVCVSPHCFISIILGSVDGHQSLCMAYISRLCPMCASFMTHLHVLCVKHTHTHTRYCLHYIAMQGERERERTQRHKQTKVRSWQILKHPECKYFKGFSMKLLNKEFYQERNSEGSGINVVVLFLQSKICPEGFFLSVGWAVFLRVTTFFFKSWSLDSLGFVPW